MINDCQSLPPAHPAQHSLSSCEKIILIALTLITTAGAFFGCYFANLNTIYQAVIPTCTFIASIIGFYFLLKRQNVLPERQVMPKEKQETPPPPLQSVAKEPTAAAKIVEKSDLTYCKARIGLPNTDNRQCLYNSLAIVFAHTEILDKKLQTLQPPIDLQEKNNALQEARQQLEVFLQQKQERALEKQKKEEKLAADRRDFITQLNEFFAVQGRGPLWFGLGWYLRQLGRNDLDTRAKEFNLHYDTTTGQIVEKPTDAEPESNVREVYEERNLREAFALAERNYDQARSSLEEQNQNVAKAKKLLAILRGQEKGELSIEDGFCLFQLSGLSHAQLNGQERLPHKETLRENLRKMLYEKPWRVIRIGGHGHWWNYVRNKGQNTVDEINDERITRNRFTFDQILEKYADTSSWEGNRGEQIYFYGFEKPLKLD